MIKKFVLNCILLLSSALYAQNNEQGKLLDSIFNMMHKQNQFNGSVLIAEKGKVILRKGYGYSNEKTKKSITARPFLSWLHVPNNLPVLLLFY